MKKILFLAVALAMCASNANAFDNEPEEGFTFMGLFGMNVSTLQNHAYGAKAGAMMGARADYVLPGAHGTYVTAGLDWTMKGGKGEFSTYQKGPGEPEYSIRGKYNLHYFEVPIRVGFRFNLSDELGFYGEFGPYFAVGVGGKHKASISGEGAEFDLIAENATFKAFKKTGSDAFKKTESGDFDPTSNENHLYFQRWDAGIGFRIGAEYNNHYNLMLGCDWGLCDIYRDNTRSKYADIYGVKLPKVRNFNFSITVGYRL